MGQDHRSAEQADEAVGGDGVPSALMKLLQAVDQRLQAIENKIDEQGQSIDLLKMSRPATLLEELRAAPGSLREEIVGRFEIEAKRSLKRSPSASSISTPAAGRLDGSDSRRVPQGTYLGRGADDD